MRPQIRRTAVAVFVALLVVAAGCNGGTAPADPATTPSTTPTTDATTTPTTGSTTSATTPTTTTGTWSPNASVEQYPPGVAANGTLTNVTTLVGAHFDATANESMVLTSEWTRQNESSVRSYAHGASPTPYYSTVNRTTDGTSTVSEFYQTGSNGYFRGIAGDRTLYSVTQNSTVHASSWQTATPHAADWQTNGAFGGPRGTLRTALTVANYSVNGTVERDGRTLVQLTADEVSPAGRNAFLTAYEGTMLVTPDGVIYDVDASSVQEVDGTTRHVENSITLDTDVDWSEPPSWVADVPHLSLSVVEDGHALEIRNTGGAALPANVSLEVYVENATEGPVYRISRFSADATGSVTTDTRLEPGEAVYVTADAAGNSTSFTLHDERARGSYTFAAAKIYSESWDVLYSLVTGTESY